MLWTFSEYFCWTYDSACISCNLVIVLRSITVACYGLNYGLGKMKRHRRIIFGSRVSFWGKLLCLCNERRLIVWKKFYVGLDALVLQSTGEDQHLRLRDNRSMICVIWHSFRNCDGKCRGKTPNNLEVLPALPPPSNSGHIRTILRETGGVGVKRWRQNNCNV